MISPCYRGRFAPSPTGPLHFGSLVTALASYLEARVHDGQWLVRIEDLDPLREPPDATDRILASLDAHGLHSDEPVRFQSQRHEAYRAVIGTLLTNRRAYTCACSRKALAEHGGRHPAHCRDLAAGSSVHRRDHHPHAIRFRLNDDRCRWTDQLLGPQEQMVRAELDDPVLQRKEGFFAYQLAVVVDDIDQAITDVVRGSDLLEMTAQQLQIYQALGGQPPRWLHIPIILNEQGQKLSKQTHAPALNDRRAAANLVDALAALGQRPPETLRSAPVEQVLAWGEAHWQRGAIELTGR
ncbi:tRNA glutamyl-Q(34) synthetase GluQRS [Marinobacter sp. C2H3]|uniref:tRNA glutamyl-Q(34) synthetase GluQRS n=1 Tax=Marinobacter sp. C2H3 TaxID=3119003 RepID=UPI00300EFD64